MYARCNIRPSRIISLQTNISKTKQSVDEMYSAICVEWVDDPFGLGLTYVNRSTFDNEQKTIFIFSFPLPNDLDV